MSAKIKYQVVFCSGGYSAIDYETYNYEQALEVRSELQAEMSLMGERDFFYIIKEVKYDSEEA